MIKNHVDLHCFVETLQTNVFVGDKDFNLVFMNAYARETLKAIEPAIQDVFQVCVEDIEGGSIHRFHRDPNRVESILKNPSALPHRAEFVFGDVILRSAINAVWGEEGQLKAYVVSWEDISESKKLERSLNAKLKELNEANQELLARNRQIEQDEADLKEAHAEQHKMHAYLNIKLAELRQSNQDLESFATIASHDLMAPVRKIINFGGLLLDNGNHFSENEKFLLNKVVSSGKRMRLLMDDILEYSRLAGNSLVFEPVNLNDVLSEVLAILSDQVLETKAEVQFEPLPVIEANKTQMVQLLQNLISNSLKYKKKDVAPVVHISSAVEEGEFVAISLKDNGVGIRDKHADLVFKPFERLSPEIEGTGMGLAICKKVVVSHGGEITVKSLPGEGGSVFKVKLPERRGR